MVIRAVNEIRDVCLFQGARIIRDVIACADGDEDDVWRVIPDFFSERNQLLRRAVTGDAEVDDLDLLAGKFGALLKPLSHHRPEGLLQRNLKSLRVRISDDGDAQRTRGFLLRVLSVPEPVA